MVEVPNRFGGNDEDCAVHGRENPLSGELQNQFSNAKKLALLRLMFQVVRRERNLRQTQVKQTQGSSQYKKAYKGQGR